MSFGVAIRTEIRAMINVTTITFSTRRTPVTLTKYFSHEIKYRLQVFECFGVEKKVLALSSITAHFRSHRVIVWVWICANTDSTNADSNQSKIHWSARSKKQWWRFW